MDQVNLMLEREDAVKVETAITAINDGDLSSARKILEEIVARAPQEYAHLYEEGGQFFVRCWNQEEFLLSVTNPDGGLKDKHVYWMPNVYPRAFYYLAYIAMEEKRPQDAIIYLDASLKLEPDQPMTLCEKGLAYAQLGEHENAISCYDLALQARPYITDSTRALALRGKGVHLMEIGELDLAKKCFLESLRYQPGHEGALNELFYVSLLKQGILNIELSESVTRGKSGRNLTCATCGTKLMEGKDNLFKVRNIEGKLVYICKDCGEKEEHQDGVYVQSDPAIAYYNLANELAEQGNFKEANDLFRKAIEIDPSHGGAHFGLGWTHNRMGQHEEAINAYKKSIDIDPEVSEPHFYLGIAYFFHNDKPQDGLQSILEAIRIKPDYFEAHFVLGKIAFNTDKFEQARNEYKKAVEIRPDSYDAHFELGHACALLSLFEEAAQAFKNAIRIKPESGEAFLRLGWAYRDCGKLRDCEKALKEAVRLNPESGEAYYHLAVAYLQQENYQDGLEACQKAAHLVPDQEDVQMSLGFTLTKLERYQEALPCYEKVLAISPQNSTAWCNKGDALEKTGKFKEAIEAYENSIKYAPADDPDDMVIEINKAIKNLKAQISKVGDQM